MEHQQIAERGGVNQPLLGLLFLERPEMFAVESLRSGTPLFVCGKAQPAGGSESFGLSRKMIAKICQFSLPPGYTRSKPVAKTKLGSLLPVIERILAEDCVAPVKQRDTAKRIFERLRDEHGYGGGNSTHPAGSALSMS